MLLSWRRCRQGRQGGLAGCPDAVEAAQHCPSLGRQRDTAPLKLHGTIRMIHSSQVHAPLDQHMLVAGMRDEAVNALRQPFRSPQMYTLGWF